MATSLQPILTELQSVLGLSVLEVSAPMSGRSHDIYVLKLPTGNKWSLRIAKDELAALLATRSVATMKHIKHMEPALQIPTVIYSAERYTILEYVHGAAIGSWNLQHLSNLRRCELLEDLAAFLYKLWTCPPPPIESDILSTTYRDWLLDEVDKAIRRSIHTCGWGDPLSFLCRRAQVDSLVPEYGGHSIAIRHGDMNALNVLVDRGRLAGVIDWDTVSFVPAPAAIHPPLFIANIPGFHNDDIPEDMDFVEDRAYLEAAIRRLSKGADNIADLLASSSGRQFFELSLRNKQINKEYIRRRLGNAEFDKKTMCVQLNMFLLANVDMESHTTVVELRSKLAEI